MLIWNREQPIREIGSESLGKFKFNYTSLSTGSHNNHGQFWLQSESIPSQEIKNFQVEDIAKTIATVLDVKLDNLVEKTIGS